MTKRIPSNIGFNYAGVALSVLSIVFFVFIQSEPDTLKKSNNQKISDESIDLTKINQKSDKIERKNLFIKTYRRVIGIGLAILAGVLYGFAYLPILYVLDNYENASQDQNDYSFSFYTGVLIGGLFYFTAYSLYKRNLPILYPKCVLPAVVSGRI